jgi:hypothetical protein
MEQIDEKYPDWYVIIHVPDDLQCSNQLAINMWK